VRTMQGKQSARRLQYTLLPLTCTCYGNVLFCLAAKLANPDADGPDTANSAGGNNILGGLPSQAEERRGERAQRQPRSKLKAGQ